MITLEKIYKIEQQWENGPLPFRPVVFAICQSMREALSAVAALTKERDELRAALNRMLLWTEHFPLSKKDMEELLMARDAAISQLAKEKPLTGEKGAV